MDESLPKELRELRHNISRVSDDNEMTECFNCWRSMYPTFSVDDRMTENLKAYSYFPERIIKNIKSCKPEFVYEKLP